MEDELAGWRLDYLYGGWTVCMEVGFVGWKLDWFDRG